MIVRLVRAVVHFLRADADRPYPPAGVVSLRLTGPPISDRKIHMVVDRLGTTFAALSDPTRRAMIERLSHGPASVHRLTEPFALSQQMISKHIACLVRARIVIKTKRGRESVCTLRPQAIKTVSDWAISYRRFWEESFDKLEVVVNQMKRAEVRDDK
jgi:DNA-binding transcriptional ArsR family regulator